MWGRVECNWQFLRAKAESAKSQRDCWPPHTHTHSTLDSTLSHTWAQLEPKCYQRCWQTDGRTTSTIKINKILARRSVIKTLRSTWNSYHTSILKSASVNFLLFLFGVGEIITLSVFEAQFLLLVGEVSSRSSHHRHTDASQDAGYRAGARLCRTHTMESHIRVHLSKQLRTF